MKRQIYLYVNINVYSNLVLCGSIFFLRMLSSMYAPAFPTIPDEGQKNSNQMLKFATRRTKGTIGIDAADQTGNKGF